MGHFEIAGFHTYRGAHSEEGLDRKIFKKFDMVFSGHYHHRSHSDNIHYLGNPYELTWQDYGDTRGFHIFDIDNYDLEFIPNPFVMFHRITYDDKKESEHGVYHNGKKIGYVVHNKKHKTHTAYHSPQGDDDDEDYGDIMDELNNFLKKFSYNYKDETLKVYKYLVCVSF